MHTSNPASSQADSARELLRQAAATVYCRPTLQALGSGLPADAGILASALLQAADSRDAKAFSNLYVAALYSGRRIAAEVLEQGAVLLPNSMILLHTALRLEGDVAKSLAVAIRSGRMGNERNAIALVAGWLDYERREKSAPPEFMALTRKVCREAVRMEQSFIRILLDPVATLSGDPVVANILNSEARGNAASTQILEQARNSTTGPGWDGSIPSRPVVETTLGSGATLKRAIPKAGRNDPCPCGSGKKFKQCCDGKISTGDQYEVGGVTISDATSHPELILTARQISEMRSYELYALDTAEHLEQEAAERGLKIEVPENFTYRIRGDKPAMQLAIQHIIGNAIKYSTSDRIIAVRFRSENDQFVISIENEGIGLPKGVEEKKIYDFGFRSPVAKSMHVNGSGIGLYTAKKIIVAHGGRLWHQNSKDKTIFSIGLPPVE